MLKRNSMSIVMLSSISDVIRATVDDMNDDTNYIHNLLISVLDEDERAYTQERYLRAFIDEIVKESGGKYNKDFSINEEKIKGVIKEVRDISDTLANNTSFRQYFEKMMKQSQFFNEVKNEFIETGENILLVLKKCGKSEYFDYYKNFFAFCISQITPEFYFILKEADILMLISRYNNDWKYIDLEFNLRIVNPFCEVIRTLLIEEKARFFDELVNL